MGSFQFKTLTASPQLTDTLTIISDEPIIGLTRLDGLPLSNPFTVSDALVQPDHWGFKFPYDLPYSIWWNERGEYLTLIEESISQSTIDGVVAHLQDPHDYLPSDTILPETVISIITHSLVSLNTGTYISGDWESLKTHDNQYVVIEEVAQTPALDLQFNFSQVVDFNGISMQLHYDGDADHVWQVLIYNYFTYQYEPVYIFTGSTSGMIWITIPIQESHKYKDSGNVSVKWLHITGGDIGDRLYIEYVVLIESLSGAGTIVNSQPVLGNYNYAISSDWAANHALALHGMSSQQVSDLSTALEHAGAPHAYAPANADQREFNPVGGEATIDTETAKVQRLNLSQDVNSWVFPAMSDNFKCEIFLLKVIADGIHNINSWAGPTIEWMTEDGAPPTISLVSGRITNIVFVGDPRSNRWCGHFAGKEII